MKEILIDLGYDFQEENEVKYFIKKLENFFIEIHQRKNANFVMLFIDRFDGEPIIISENVKPETINKLEEFIKII